MDERQYKENARKIIELACGMTSWQWSRISHLIQCELDKEKNRVTFEKPEHLGLLMKQNFI